MSNDFDLDKSRWYSTMKLGLASKQARNDAAVICERAPILARFGFDAVVLSEICSAETALSDALLAVKLARSEYERMTAPVHMQAAE